MVLRIAHWRSLLLASHNAGCQVNDPRALRIRLDVKEAARQKSPLQMLGKSYGLSYETVKRYRTISTSYRRHILIHAQYTGGHGDNVVIIMQPDFQSLPEVCQDEGLHNL